MPIYDLKCRGCSAVQTDVLQRIETEQPICGRCGERFERVWLSRAPYALGDECDVTIRHGLCEADGTPRRFRSKAEIRRVAAEKGWTPFVQHVGSEGGDKSPHTSRWV